MEIAGDARSNVDDLSNDEDMDEQISSINVRVSDLTGIFAVS